MSAPNAERYMTNPKLPRLTPGEAVRNRPSVQYRPKLSIEGTGWLALYGDDLQGGVAGSGNSPEAAMLDFDRQWYKPLSQKYIQKVREQQERAKAERLSLAGTEPKAPPSRERQEGDWVVKLQPQEFKSAAQLIAEMKARKRTRNIVVVLAAVVLAFFAGFWVGHPTWFK